VRLLRSWPRRVPEGRAYVADGIERLVIDNCHYGPLAQIADDVLLLEWDVAVGREELETFARRAQRTPGRVLVAPYRIYYWTLSEPVWAHRRWDGTGTGTTVPQGAKPVATGDPFCNLFGLGLVYLPRALVAGYFRDGFAAHFGDVEFSMWHHWRVAEEVPIAWECPAVHLNYDLPATLGD